IKAEWARNCCLGKRGDRCFVAYKDNSPTGFLAALLGQEGEQYVATIDLIAVDELLRGRGFGCALVAAFASLYRERQARLRVSTQVANIPALRFYQRLGFVVARSAYVLHYHADV
ncbi:GNAT family N-acetyltransferase, partial [bacterium]|nr:GNAT family N-acetyltransferase [bacterium]